MPESPGEPEGWRTRTREWLDALCYYSLWATLNL